MCHLNMWDMSVTYRIDTISACTIYTYTFPHDLHKYTRLIRIVQEIPAVNMQYYAQVQTIWGGSSLLSIPHPLYDSINSLRVIKQFYITASLCMFRQAYISTKLVVYTYC